VSPTGVTEDASAGDDNAGPPVLVIALAAGGGGLLLVALLVGVYCFRKRQSRVSEVRAYWTIPHQRVLSGRAPTLPRHASVVPAAAGRVRIRARVWRA
jgi:hypothetical protein